VSTTPLADVLAEAERVAAAAERSGVTLRLLGGAGICVHSESARRPPLSRRYGDLDFVTSSRQRADVERLFVGLGYAADPRFNTLNGHRRLLYLDAGNARQVDVFIDVMRMCHVIDLRGRLALSGPALAPADLLLTKLQIYEINQKDLVDLVALLLDHATAEHDEDAINVGYVGRLTAEDWGLYRTVQLNIARVRGMLPDLAVDTAPAARRLDEIWSAIEQAPKSLRWRLRARVGDRIPWYELPEEVRQPYET
jgi:hypothetical protein